MNFFEKIRETIMKFFRTDAEKEFNVEFITSPEIEKEVEISTPHTQIPANSYYQYSTLSASEKTVYTRIEVFLFLPYQNTCPLKTRHLPKYAKLY